jgi:hypothetical protein
MRPRDADALRALLARGAARLRLLGVLRGAAVFALVAAVLTVTPLVPAHDLPRALAVLGASMLLGAIVYGGRAAATPAAVAARIERVAPELRNLLVTSEELLRAPHTVAPAIVERIGSEAVERVRAVRLDVAMPAVGEYRLLIAALGFWTAIAAWRTGGLDDAITRQRVRMAVGVARVEVVVTPPTYTDRPTTTLRDPTRLEVMRGSRLRITVDAGADTVRIETLDGARDARRTASDRFVTELTADADGFVAIDARRGGRPLAARRLIGLAVTSDAPPQLALSAPGHDLVFPDSRRTIALAADATDDLGLASLRLRYTKVSGSGERFTFVDGEVPLTISRRDATHWSARADWSLAPLALEPGDMVVYRAVATDRRPGAPPVESDAFIAEIAAPGGVAAAGFAVDPEQQRYALSQQMIVLKTERLLAKRARLDPAAFADSAAEIASEQRRVRAEFVFMMGGEMADLAGADADPTTLDETAEAAAEDDLSAGRMANRGRDALLRAIRYMSRAATLLTTDEVPRALADEKSAVTQLEQAFSRSRILLRALTERERIDMARRLSGTLTDAASDRSPAVTAEPDARADALRRVLADVTSLAAAPTAADAPRAAGLLAERILRIDATAPDARAAAAALASVADAGAAGRAPAAREALDRAATALTALVRRGLQDAPGQAATAERSRLDGATDAARRRARGLP